MNHQKSILFRLYASEAGSTFTSQYVLFAIPVVAVTVLNARDSEVALLNAASGLGILIFLLLLGPLADVRRKDLLLGFLSIARGVAAALLTYAFMQDAVSITVLIVGVFFIGGMTALYESSVSAYIPALVRPSKLPTANSWIAGLRSAADIGAGAAAGWVLQYLGPSWLMAVVAALYIVVSVGPFSMRPVFKPGGGSIQRADKADSETGKSFIQEALAGFNILFRDRAQFRMNLGIFQFNLFTSAVQAIFAVYAIRYADLTAITFGLAGTIGGLIGLLGVWISVKAIRKFRPHRLMAATLMIPGIMGIFIVLLPVFTPTSQIFVLGAALGIWAAATLTNIALFETIKQVLVPSQYLGRYSAASRLFTWGIEPVGALLAALAVTYAPISVVLTIAFGGIFASGFWVIREKSLIAITNRQLYEYMSEAAK